MPPSKVPPQHSGDIPVGTVIDWYRPNVGVALPDGFQFCDGAVISDTRSAWVGINTPDLRNTFVRGKNDTTFGLTSGGSDTKDLSHQHPYMYSYRTFNQAGQTGVLSDQIGPVVGDQTVYSFRTDIDNYNLWLNTVPLTSHSPTETLTRSSGSSSQNIVPAYVGLIKLIKIF